MTHRHDPLQEVPVEPSPTAAAASGPEPSPRRGFFRRLTYAIGGVATAIVGLPVVGYILGSRPRAVHWIDVGRTGDFAAGETRLVTFDNPLSQPWDGMTAHTGVYVRRLEDDAAAPSGPGRFQVFAVNCAHLGCPVEWFPQSGLFMCPCHGGVYHADGARASGPPPRGLFTCQWRVRGDKLEVQAPHYPSLQDTEDQS
jgi:menaquinol-cytochrome c reductase iron-sulfur subunit